MLQTRGLGICFGAHWAVRSVDSEFKPGVLTAIVGPNGAGKTTFFNLLSGQLRPSEGEIFFEGAPITVWPAHRRACAGLGRAFQLTQLFPRLTVLENIRLAVQATRDGAHRRGRRLWTIWSDHEDLVEEARAIAERLSLGPQQNQLAFTLSHGDQRKLEVGVLLAMRPKVFLFDEPTAGMNAREAPVILNLIADIKRDPSACVLLVEHKMDVVKALADRVMVMHNGERIAEGLPAEVMALPVVREAYLGSSAGVQHAET
ncbi:MAG: hypothetical protein RLY30_1220 [Pseudomonadota bacterium]|jgi:branched-chain amino acid transport system ATP-binding protein